MNEQAIATIIRKHNSDGGYNYDLEQKFCGCGESYPKGTHPDHVAQAIFAAIQADAQ